MLVFFFFFWFVFLRLRFFFFVFFFFSCRCKSVDTFLYMYLKQLEIKIARSLAAKFSTCFFAIFLQSEDGGWQITQNKLFLQKNGGWSALCVPRCLDLPKEDTMNEIFDICLDNGKNGPFPI